MNARIPYGAREILSLRSAGHRPADLVLISFVGQLRESNPMVIAKPDAAYDWRFLVGLSVAIVATTETPYLSRIAQEIEAVSPRNLAVWFADKQDGSNLIIHGYRSATKYGRRMGLVQRVAWAGLGADMPYRDCLVGIARQTKARATNNAGLFDAALVDLAQIGFKRIFGNIWEAA